MRKIYFSVIVASMILLMVSLSFAQSPRQPTSSEGKTGFTNVAVRGLNATNVPAYIEITAVDGDVFYLFVDADARLRIASDIAVGLAASPQTTDWTTDAQGKIVGEQKTFNE